MTRLRRWRTPFLGLLAVAVIGRPLGLGWRAFDTSRRVTPLVGKLQDEDVYVRVRAAKQLTKMGPAARRAIPALTAALGDENFNVRWRAADALGAMGPKAKAAVPALTAQLKDEDLYAAHAAAMALRKIDTDTAASTGIR
jgi:HEAT repeat protein